MFSPNPVSLEQLLNLLPDVVLQTTGDWTITYLNPAWQTLTGHGVDSTIGQSLLEYLHPEDTKMLGAGMLIFRLRLATHEYRWVRLRIQNTYDSTGQVNSRNGVLTDVQKASEQTLLEDRNRYLRLLETIDGVVWEAERNFGNTFLSPQVERLFGYTTEEWRANPNFWRDHVHPEDFPSALLIDEAAYNATHTYTYEMNYRFYAKSGKIVWVRDLCRVVVEANMPTRMIGLMIDVSRQKQTELELAQSENRYVLATRGSNDGIWDWDIVNDLLHVSGRFNQIVGLPSITTTHQGGWRFLEPLVSPDDLERVQTAHRNHLNGATQGMSVDFRVRHSTGRLVWVNWRGLAQFEAGRAMRMAGSLSDLAERGSSYDPLTNLPGRPLFRDRLEQAVKLQSEANPKGFAVLLLDLNRFKAINDTFGHLVGDALLQHVARRLESGVYSSDLVARMSGDEFIVLLESVDVIQATTIAARIGAALSKPYQLGSHTINSGASIGVVSSQTNFLTAEDYLRAADVAMYQAKTRKLGACVYGLETSAT
jgi:diguanylate cyclase (GGDEF)-like protein/PAS domain S-box-containing protein